MIYAIAAVAWVVRTCVELSWKVTVSLIAYVDPRVQPVALFDADVVDPGFAGNGEKVNDGLHVPAGKVAFIPVMGTSPVFLTTTAQVPSPAGVATSLTWSIIAVGLLPAMPARLKKTPDTTTAAATVIAISNITATNGLIPSDLFLLFIP